MRFSKRALSMILVILVAVLPVCGDDLYEDKQETVKTWMTIGGSLASLAIARVSAFSLCPEGTPVANSLLATIPTAGVGAAAGAMAGRWIADTALSMKTSKLLSPIVGAGLGMLGGGFVGGISFALAFAIAVPLLEVEPGYWGSFNYPQALGMAFLAGAFWGGVTGIPAGAVTVPIISFYMDF
jgi:hypothetical protein